MTVDAEENGAPLDAATASLLGQHAEHVRVPSTSDAVYKDQCIYSFDTPRSPSGLYVCMHLFVGVSADRVDRYVQATGRRVFLHLRSVGAPASRADAGVAAAADEPERKITRLAIGVEGGFPAAATDAERRAHLVYRHHDAIVILPERVRVALPVRASDEPVDDQTLLQQMLAMNLPARLAESAAALLTVHSASERRDLAAAAGTWDGESRVVSRHADSLVQLDNGVKVPPCGWQCERCDKTDNLWLNLSDGAVLCGRRFFDGSGGNNHALEHYRDTGHPLAVKLGTISADSATADVFSYAEDDMVVDPHIEKHLHHFGIKLAGMYKTDKSMVELEVEINKRVGEWAVIQEQGQTLTPLYGAGYTGIKNLGNSCYMNSLMQTLFIIPEFVERYYRSAELIFGELSPLEIVNDFDAQMAKLADGLLSGRYSHAPAVGKRRDAAAADVHSAEQDRSTDDNDDAGGDDESNCGGDIEPLTLKSVIGQGHAEFSGKRQQDAHEFFLHVINLIERSCHRRQHLRRARDASIGGGGGELVNPADVFRHQVEERLQCGSSGQVRYQRRVEYCLCLPVPVGQATNGDEVREYQQRRQQAATAGAAAPAESVVRPRVPYQRCVEALAAARTIDHFFSPAVRAKTTAEQTLRLATFPDWLLVQLQKFSVGDDWLPTKLDVSVDMPQLLDLTELRATGLQPHEQPMPDDAPSTAASATQSCAVQDDIDEAVVVQLSEMGFPVDACRRAICRTGNSGLEAALHWVMEHMTDADFAAPFTMSSADGRSSTTVSGREQTLDEASVQLIVSMGFSRGQAERALRETSNNVERAADWIFNHQHELSQDEHCSSSSAADAGCGSETDAAGVCRDGQPLYQLAAFISHMGTSSESGHYVCHVRRDARWCIFNDEKVAESRQPPIELGYLYLYQRCSP